MGDLVLEPRSRVITAADSDHSNSEVAELVKLVTRYGPHISRIAREIHVHKETVRYRYKRLLRKGYSLTAVPDYERLGLRRVVALAEFSERFMPYADAILTAMSELCYLSSFSKTLSEDTYSIQANVPQEHVGSWMHFMRALKERGLFSSIQVVPFEWVWVVPMRSETYDFENDLWQFDWMSKPKVEPTSVFSPSSSGKFDVLDLKLLQQLQIDPDVSLFAMAEKLQVNYKTLNWHHRTHVVRNRLLKGYLINWAGTRYDPKLEKALHRRHRYMWIELLVTDVTENEKMELIAKVTRLPFVWLLACGQNFFAQIAFPIETMTEALVFVKDVISPVKNKASFRFMDQANALRFSLKPNLYSPEERKWKFDEAELLRTFDKLVLEIKGMTS